MNYKKPLHNVATHELDPTSLGKVKEDPPILVTVGLEDYFHVGAFSRVIRSGRWSRFEQRIEGNTHRTLDLLERHNINATFFVMGWIADQFPELVKAVSDKGHEIANQGYSHRTIQEIGSPGAFRDDLLRSRAALERATGRKLIGYRVPHFLTPSTLWALDILAEEGYLYDASLRPFLGQFCEENRFIHHHDFGENKLVELPVSSLMFGKWAFPLAAGNGFRQLPEPFVRSFVAQWFKQYRQPFVTYFHVWELDPEQPRIQTSSFLNKIRHYRNLDKMEDILSYYFSTYPCSGIARFLDLEEETFTKPEGLEQVESEKQKVHAPEKLPLELAVSEPKIPITVVIPCYNEAPTLIYLRNTLRTMQREMSKKYKLFFLFVDDGSKDETVEKLRELFPDGDSYRTVLHPVNRGVSAAIMTGIEQADSEIVCSMDCDCTYDPMTFAQMIPELRDDVAMVTASPYHEEGHVVNVPNWRLGLSRGASFLYQKILGQDLATFTSCFRVYRRSLVTKVELNEDGFLGVAELLGRLALSGEKIIEVPATLESRMFGTSKMKTLQTIKGHLVLLAELGRLRASHSASSK